jgi:hypothetical protein
MGLLAEIQREATDANSPVSALLRRCQILAFRLKNEAFKRWVGYELNGYPDGAELPPYRAPMQGVLKATVMNPARWMKGILVPRSLLPNYARDIGTFSFRDGVSAMEATVAEARRAEVTTLRTPIPPELFADLEIMEMSTTVEMWVELPVTAYASVLDSVRNRALQFALEIEVEKAVAGEVASNHEPVSEDRVNRLVSTVVYGGNVNVGAGDGPVTQINVGVTPGDLTSLIDALKGLGVPAEDIESLRAAIDQDQHETDEKPGPRTREWIGRMTMAAVRGAGYVGGGATATVIGTAVAKYLGLV